MNRLFMLILVLSIGFMNGCASPRRGAQNPFYFPEQVVKDDCLAQTWRVLSKPEQKDAPPSVRFVQLTSPEPGKYSLANYDFLCPMSEENTNPPVKINADIHLFRLNEKYYFDIEFTDPIVHLRNHHIVETVVLGNWLLVGLPNIDKDALKEQTGLVPLVCKNEEEKSWDFYTASTEQLQKAITASESKEKPIFGFLNPFVKTLPVYCCVKNLKVTSTGLLSAKSRTLFYYTILVQSEESLNLDKDKNIKLSPIAQMSDEEKKNLKENTFLGCIMLAYITNDCSSLNKICKDRFGSQFKPFLDVNDAVSRYLELFPEEIKSDPKFKENFDQIKLLIDLLKDSDPTLGVDPALPDALKAYAQAQANTYVEGFTDDTLLLYINARKKVEEVKKLIETLKKDNSDN